MRQAFLSWSSGRWWNSGTERRKATRAADERAPATVPGVSPGWPPGLSLGGVGEGARCSAYECSRAIVAADWYTDCSDRDCIVVLSCVFCLFFVWRIF